MVWMPASLEASALSFRCSSVSGCSLVALAQPAFSLEVCLQRASPESVVFLPHSEYFLDGPCSQVCPSPFCGSQLLEDHKRATDKPESKDHPKNTPSEEEKPQTPARPAEGKPPVKKPAAQEPPANTQKPKNNGKTVLKPPAKPASKPSAGTSTNDSGAPPQ